MTYDSIMHKVNIIPVEIPNFCLDGMKNIRVEEMHEFLAWGASLTIDHALSVPQYVSDGKAVPDVAGCFYNQFMVKEFLDGIMETHK